MVINKQKKEFSATGRRKNAIARVRLLPGAGEITINKKPYREYFGRECLQLVLNTPFEATGTAGKFTVFANAVGGGTSGQAGAVSLGIARALVAMNPDLRKPLKKLGLLTRDDRIKERRKVGRRKARRSPQYSKR